MSVALTKSREKQLCRINWALVSVFFSAYSVIEHISNVIQSFVGMEVTSEKATI